MEKAYDAKELALRLKPHGLDLGEEAAKKLVDVLLTWVDDSAKLSKTPIDDVLMSIVKPLHPYIMSQLDKIDGQVG